MIISKESPLRKIPAELDRKQAYFIDSIRLSIETIDISYNKLYQIILNITKTKRIITTEPFLYAWSIIDFTHRLKNLLRYMPYLKQNTPIMKNFFKQADKTRHFRNIFQHLNNEIMNPKNAPPFWGIINWFIFDDIKKAKGKLYYLMPGKLYSESPILITNENLFPDKIFLKNKIQYIKLKYGENIINLTDIITEIIKVVKFMEKVTFETMKKYENLHYLAGNILMTISIESKEK